MEDETGPLDSSNSSERLFSDNRDDETSRTTIITVFAEIDTLPGAEVQSAVSNWYGEAHSAEDGLSMCRHIVQAFKGVLVVGTTFWYEAVEDGFHICTDIGVAVLVDAKSATRVLGEDVDKSRAG